MAAKIFKKIGMGIIYYIIATLFSTVFDMFGIIVSRGFFFAVLQALALGIIILAISRYLRIAKLKKEHKGDESEEKKIFNSDIKTKILFVIKSKDFITEVILFVIASTIIFLNPAMGGGAIASVGAFPSVAAYVLLLIASIILTAVYMAVLDVAAWIMAYNRCYKRREY